MPSNDSSVLIIGAGIFGTSTAYHLSLARQSFPNVTILDRSPYPPSHAASTDINKIVREDYTSPFYMGLASNALHAWKTWPVLQDVHGRRFFHETGWIALSNRGNDIAERIRANFRQRGRDVTGDINVGEGSDVKEKWGGILKDMDLEDPKIEKGYWNPEAGWADAGDAVARMLQEAVKNGVKYETGDVERLILMKGKVGGVRMKDGRVYEADKVVLATGAWTSQLLSPVEDELGIEDGHRVEEQVTAAGVSVAHYKLSEGEYKNFKDTPVVVYGDRGEIIPPPESSRLLKFTNTISFTNKITTPSGHQISVPPDRPQTIVPQKLQQEALSYMVAKIVPSLALREPEYWRICWDSITPSQDQLITQHPHPQLNNLYLAVGGSFHSWKFLPTIGIHVINVLNGVSNGVEMDERWKWKTEKLQGRGAHEKVVPQRELREFEE